MHHHAHLKKIEKSPSHEPSKRMQVTRKLRADKLAPPGHRAERLAIIL
jgi:hypothetical protein